jgi:hypothetical protein
MPVVTRSQYKTAHKLAKEYVDVFAYDKLKSEMRNLALDFNSKAVFEKSTSLRECVARMTVIIEPAIAYIAQDVTISQLKLMTVLHNRMLFLATQLKSYGETANANKVYDFAVQLVRHMEKHFKNIIIMYTNQSRIAGYIITKDTHIDFSNYLYSSE